MTNFTMLNDEETTALIAVAQAHGARQEARRNASNFQLHIESAEREIASAEKNYRRFGSFEDCGQSYEDGVTRARAERRKVDEILKTAVKQKVKAEKYFKLVKLTMIEQYPNIAPFVDKFDEISKNEIKRPVAEDAIGMKL